jgi:hypothetical protein
MRDWFVLMAHLIVTTIRTVTPGGARAVIAESLLLKHQLLILILNRSRKKAPKLRALDRILLGLGALLVSPQRILKVAVAIRPSTLLRFHRALVRRKYQWLFSSKTRHRPGPKGPSKELIAAILEIKRLNPHFGERLGLHPLAVREFRLHTHSYIQFVYPTDPQSILHRADASWRTARRLTTSSSSVAVEATVCKTARSGIAFKEVARI